VTMRTFKICGLLSTLIAPLAIASPDEAPRFLSVTATAYNSVEAQTNSDPWTAAWGDRLRNGMKVIAVSRDLLAMGLDRGTVVEIDGLDGEYVVLDKMNKRWERKIDVYFGDDIAAARSFGSRSVILRWQGPDGSPLAAVSAGPTDAGDNPGDLLAESEPR